MEQVLRWDPDIVISGYHHSSVPGEFYRTVWQDPLWKLTRAVKTGEVCEAPQYPFSWIDRPPSVNCIIVAGRRPPPLRSRGSASTFALTLQSMTKSAGISTQAGCRLAFVRP